MKDLKYLAAYTIPLSYLLGINLEGYYTYLTPIYVFILIPIIELFTSSSTKNIDEKEKLTKSKKKLFDILLYINLPIVYVVIIYSMYIVNNNALQNYEIIGIIISTGMVLGANGINVGHELGHRFTKERYIAKALLVPSLYMHFYIEHNYGHHQKIGTKEDPATAKFNQPIFFFWCTSIFGQYVSAWKIQLSLLKKKKNFFSFKNDMLWYTVITSNYIVLVFLIFGTNGIITAFFSALVSVLLLETINYIEHYGLKRKKTNTGRYERVREIHSWNSNHLLGRILLFELTRHSDHHYKASKKYQLLDHHTNSPQLPFGYPTCMVLSLFPPIWFLIINKLIPDEMKIE